MEFYSSLDASQLDAETPTLFELISSAQLESLLSPSLRYILVHYTSKYPRYLLSINNRFDELNLVVRSFIEWYFIKYWHGSFTENFYGLKRVNNVIADTSKLSQLVPQLIEERREISGLQQLVSVFEITGVGYIHEKLSYYYDIWYTKYITQQLNISELNTPEENKKIFWKRKFVEIYPYVQSGYKLLNLLTTFAYLAGKSKSPTFLTWLFNINFSRLNQYDHEKYEKKPNTDKPKRSRIAPATDYEILWRLLRKRILGPSWKAIKYVLGTFFPVAIFTLKFLEWWNNSEFSNKLLKSQGSLLDFTLPSPATVTTALERSKQFPKKYIPKKYKSGKTCPLCNNELTNPAIIETGYVFDYSCIYNYLQQSHKIIGEKLNEKITHDDDDDEEEVSEDEDENENEKEKEKHDDEDTSKESKPGLVTYDLKKGGRCPITGKKLLGCKWNSIKEEWEIEGIRRLIF